MPTLGSLLNLAALQLIDVDGGTKWNEALGEPIPKVVKAWYNTHQHSMEPIFHSRVMKHPCRVYNENEAKLFYGGLDILRWHFKNASPDVKDTLALELVEWLKLQKPWALNSGKDHVFVLGKVSWDFRRRDDSPWVSTFLNLEEMQNLIKLLIERQPWHVNDIGIPHPTYFHPHSDEDIISWQFKIIQSSRNNLVSFAGGAKPDSPDSIRSVLINQYTLASTGTCKFQNCSSGGCDKPESIIKLFLESEFCLQPPGESPTRKSCTKVSEIKEDNSANIVEEVEDDDALICCVECSVESWVMDSGASFHATPCKDLMLNFRVGNFGKEGYRVTFGDRQWKVIKGNLVIARGEKKVTLYIVEQSSYEANTVADEIESSTLWHKRLGHMSEKGRTPKAKKLEIVHSDVYGPTTVASLGGSRYYVTFIDDSTRKVWVYFLKNKSDVFATFKKWKTEVENQTGLKVKSLMSDNGGEYSSDEFKSYCTEFGIRMIKTIPETPQQNGVAERMNRTLNERAKSMRLHAGLPKMFWADAVSTAAYLINRGPSSPLGFKIPEEEWQEKEVELTKKVVRSRDVTFNENVVYKDKLVVDSEFTKEQPEKEEAVLEDITETDLAGNSGSSEYVDDRVPVTQRYSPSAYYLLTEEGEPQCYSEALQVNDSVPWKSAMDEEMSSLEKNETWSLTELPAGKKALHNKWVFRIKEEHDGSKRYKASIVAAEELHLEQLDVKTAFLHGDLEEDIYMVQPEGFQVAGKENLLCKLIKSLYGLKQAPRQWYLKFDSFMMKNGYTRSVMDHCCYFTQFDSSYIILLLYVDDMLIAGSNMREINRLKRQMFEEFEMKDMGAAKQILGMSIIRDRTESTLKLSQEKYVEKLLQKFSV
ncbi:hypothetical protein AgCh_023527 [Apium graveolens]